jgi:FlaG/FlaF family flagellin (archaellin)
MKTTITFCLAAVLSLIITNNVSAQNSTTPFTAAQSSSVKVNAGLVKIVSFTGSINNEKVLLNWTVEENQDANQFEVEKSTNGNDFVMAALVFGTDKKDTDNYMFYEKAKNAKTSYRVKIILKNGTAFYSAVITPGSAQ